MAAPATDVLVSEIYMSCEKMAEPLQTEAAAVAVTATDGDGAAKPSEKVDVNGEKSEKLEGKGDGAEDEFNVEAEGADGEAHGDGGEDDEEGNDDDEEDDDDDAVPDDDDGEDDDDDDGEDDDDDDGEEDEEDEDEAPAQPAAKKIKK